MFLMFFLMGGTEVVYPVLLVFLIYAVYADQTCPLAGQGFILNGYFGSFPAEAGALEPAVFCLVDWLHPSGL